MEITADILYTVWLSVSCFKKKLTAVQRPQNGNTLLAECVFILNNFKWMSGLFVVCSFFDDRVKASRPWQSTEKSINKLRNIVCILSIPNKIWLCSHCWRKFQDNSNFWLLWDRGSWYRWSYDINTVCLQLHVITSSSSHSTVQELVLFCLKPVRRDGREVDIRFRK